MLGRMSAEVRGIRRRIVDICAWAAAHEPQIHYAQVRPMRSVVPVNRWKLRALPITADCSESTTGIYKAAGAPDPNGLGYNGQGYTGSMLSHLPHVSKYGARKGDLVIFGSAPGHHVVILLQTPVLHHDPLVFSHGFEGGPLILRLSQEAAFHAGDRLTFLRGMPRRLA